MATIIEQGAQFPFGFKMTNPMYSWDVYAGPYENEADAMAVFPTGLRKVGRAIGIYTDATKKAVKIYNWEKNTSDAWVLKPQAGEYELTSAKVIAALGYTPMATTHAANGVTTALITNWNTAFTNNHTHSNKTVLDGITSALITNWNGAVTDKHTHSNKAILDATTASYTTADKTKLDSLVNYELTSAKVISALGYTPMATTHAANGVTTALITNWNTAFTNNHTHSNKTVLDATTASYTTADKTKLDGLVNYELTSAKIVSALGYTPMANTHAANGVTTTLIGNWNTAFTNNHTHSNKTVLDGITQAKINAWDAKPAGITGTKLRYVLMNPDGSFNVGVPSVGIVSKALGLDSEGNPVSGETIKLIDLDTTLNPLSETELLLKESMFVICPNINIMYVRTGAFWSKINLTTV